MPFASISHCQSPASYNSLAADNPCALLTSPTGMARADRTLVEDLFADGHIQVCGQRAGG